MPRYKLIIEYDGSSFAGWQVQKMQRSVQQSIMTAVEHFCGTPTIVHGAGRTDSGVHALGQVAHLDLVRGWSATTVRDAINYYLKPDPIAILHAEIVNNTFDARFSALLRHYRYRIIQRRAPLVLDVSRAWRVPSLLNVEMMRQASLMLIGRHDFTTFRAISCQAKSPVKTLDCIDIQDMGDDIYFHISARSFMHNQVRSMVGVLKLAGEGKWPLSRVSSALAARDRSACGPVAPACGLYLLRVDYSASRAEPDISLAAK